MFLLSFLQHLKNSYFVDGGTLQNSRGLGPGITVVNEWHWSNEFAIEGLSEALRYEVAQFGIKAADCEYKLE